MAALYRDQTRRRVSGHDAAVATSVARPAARVEARPDESHGADTTVAEPPLTQRVDDTINAVQHAIASLEAFRKTLRSQQDEAYALTQKAEAAQTEDARLKRRLAELKLEFAAERTRATKAEQRARQLDASIVALENRMHSMRQETEQLIEAARRVLSEQASGSRRPLRGSKRYAA